MSNTTASQRPNSPRAEITTGVFAGKFAKKCTGRRWAIGPKHTSGMWTPFAFSAVEPSEATADTVRWINKPHWTTVCEKVGKPTPEQAFTS